MMQPLPGLKLFFCVSAGPDCVGVLVNQEHVC